MGQSTSTQANTKHHHENFYVTRYLSQLKLDERPQSVNNIINQEQQRRIYRDTTSQPINLPPILQIKPKQKQQRRVARNILHIANRQSIQSNNLSRLFK